MDRVDELVLMESGAVVNPLVKKMKAKAEATLKFSYL
jgi:hypothetical protein